MRRKISPIWSVLLVLVVSIAVFVPGCEGEACTGEIEVKATLCDAPWEGDVQYTLTGPGAAAPTVIDGTNVTALFDNVDCGDWTCEYVSGGPPGAYLVDITPDPTQEVTSGETITFTLNFEQCIIEVEATLCDAPWEGDVDYTLTGPGSPINGTNAPASFNVECGNWTCAYVSGGPPGAYFVDITPDPTQEVTCGGNITFTLNFELDQDAWIDIAELPWTLNGVPLPPTTPPDIFEYDAFPCDVIDVHFQQGVEGCEERIVPVNETSWLMIHYMGYRDPFTGQPAPPPMEPVWLYVVNDDCAVEKLPTPPEKVSQMTSLWGEPIPPSADFPLVFCEETLLDVETIWMLEKEIDYTKSINWLGISSEFPLPHPCVLFELVIPPIMGFYDFVLIPYAEVELMDDVDVDEDNNYAEGPPLLLTVDFSPFL